MKKFLNILCRIIEILIIIYVVFISSCILYRNKFGYTQFNSKTLVSVTKHNEKYLSDSKIGDLLIISSTNEIVSGDYIYYYGIINNRYIVKKSKVINVITKNNNKIYKLDNKASVSNIRVIGNDSKIKQKKNLGKVFDILVSKKGFLIFVLLPITLIFIYQLYELMVIIKLKKEKRKIDKTEELEIL